MENRIQQLSIIKSDIVSKHRALKLLIEAEGTLLADMISKSGCLLMQHNSAECRSALIAWHYSELKHLNSAYMEALKDIEDNSPTKSIASPLKVDLLSE